MCFAKQRLKVEEQALQVMSLVQDPWLLGQPFAVQESVVQVEIFYVPTYRGSSRVQSDKCDRHRFENFVP